MDRLDNRPVNRESGNANGFLALSVVLAAIAYLPVLNNDFIADDYAILAGVEALKTHAFYLFTVPPNNFRVISYLIFAAIKYFVGYHASYYYAAGILLHIANVILLNRLLRALTADAFIVRTATMFFAVFQAPHEVVFWNAAMNESTLALFAFLTLLLWWKDRYIAATLCYGLALCSKESAVIILPAILILDIYRKRRLFDRPHALLLIPTAAFAGVFLYTFAGNHMVSSNSYRLGPRAILVLARSLHRLAWPWLYFFPGMYWILKKRLPVGLRGIAFYLAAVVLPMLPYMFITYLPFLPSRQVYLASAVLVTVLAALLKPIRHTTLASVFVVSFIAFNIGYLWLKKDEQFSGGALPTTKLVEALRSRPPERTLILDFPIPYTEIAYAAVLAVPGWTPDLIVVDRPEDCVHCKQLRWNPTLRKYE